MEILVAGVVGLLFLGVGLGIGFYLRRQALDAAASVAADRARQEEALAAERLRAREEALAEARRDAESKGAALDAARREARSLEARVSALQAELDTERKAAERTKNELRAEVQELARKALDQHGGAMLEQNKARIELLLKPFAEQFESFKATVLSTHATDKGERSALAEQLKGLQEAQKDLHRDAEALAKALTGDSKKQGDWGEIMLERILETAGLVEGRDYALQSTHTDAEGGRKRPDALVYLPEQRAVVVDAKCSLTAFVEAAAAAAEADREPHLKAHVASLRAHVKGLAGKKYTEVLKERSLDFVLLFVPSEPAFFAALSRDPGLYEEAFHQGVVLCSPTTLLAALRLIAQLWRTERQNQNAQQIAEEAGNLLEKLSAFVEDLNGVGNRLRQAQESWEAAQNKLSTGKGNVIRRAAAIARLGAPVKSKEVRELLAPAAGDAGEGAGES